MSTLSRGTSGPSGHTGSHPPPQLFGGNYAASQPASTHTSPEQSTVNQIRKLTRTVDTILRQQEESSVTKDQFDGLLKALDRLGLGMNDGNVVYKPQLIRNDSLLISLERIKEKLKDASDRLEIMGHTGNNEDGKVVSELVDSIRNEVTDCQSVIVAAEAPGELPPPAPRACFGRDEQIQKIVGLAESLEPMALIGAGGIDKTSIALTVLHDIRIKQRFGENRRFVRCDQFPATLPHFLSRLSKVTGAGIESPDNLASLLPLLSSKETFVILDNAESILDPEGTDALEIYDCVEELCQLETICICITSRISTVPPDCEVLDIPTLSMEAARDVFHKKYKRCGRSGLVDDVLRQLEFHPLSVALLATVAQQNRWDVKRLVQEWEGRRTDTLRTVHRTSLAATIELSLDSPMFKGLGPDARGVLGVIAFYPQGVDEKNLEWLFPTVSNRTDIFDTLCMLSLVYRSNGFITMLAPLRDHLRPKDPMSSPILCTTKERYSTQLLVNCMIETEEGRWIVSEDLNVEHLLDVFTSADPNSDYVWYACSKFLEHLIWHKPRPTMLRKRIEKLPDNHPVKPQCLLYLAHLYGINGNPKEDVLLLRHVLKLERERGDDNKVARVLGDLSRSNLLLGSREEGIDQVREAMEIYERLGQTMGRARCLHTLAGLLWADGQLDAAKEAIFEAFELLPEKGEEPDVCMSHKILGDIYHSQGEIEKAVYHFKLALGITFSPRNRYCSAYSLYMIHSALAWIFLDVGRLNDAQFHNEQAKSLSLNDSHQLARAVLVQALIYRDQRRLEAAASEALRAQGIFEKLGSLKAVEDCKTLLQNIEDLKPCFQILEFLKLLVQCLKNFKLLREIEEATESLTPSDESDTNAPGASSSTPHDHSPAGFQS